MKNVVGRIFTGKFEEILVRQKKDEDIEMGDLLVAEGKNEYSILQTFDLVYGSQVPDRVKTLMAGMKLEGYGEGLDFTDPELSNYIIALLKNLVTVRDEGEEMNSYTPKKLPRFFSELRRVRKEDFDFIKTPEKPLTIGKVRSGSKILDVDISLPGDDVLRHHVLIPASTGKGKSNLVKVMAYNLLEKDSCGLLILDPHDEYYGTSGAGLSNHPKSGKYLTMYSPNPPPGEKTLAFHISQLRPWDLEEVIDVSEAQSEALAAYYQEYRENWLEMLVLEENTIEGISERTVTVLQRKINVYMGLREENGEITCESIFKTDMGEATINDILKALEKGKKVILDTSNLEDQVELLAGSIIAKRIFSRYRNYKSSGDLSEKPVISIVLEEAPRVIGVNSLIRSGNIFEKIAREGRKFKIGLTAITQLPSVIPKEILANMNTKIILGTEMETERRSLIESASQDLSKDDRNIASLDIGEAIVTSTFTKFAIPVDIPLFEELMKEESGQDASKTIQTEHFGVDMEE